MANPFNMPQLFQMPELPKLYESLVGSPEAASLELDENLFDNYYQQNKLWNEGAKVGGGQTYDKLDPPTQFKDPSKEMYNDFSGTYYL